MLFECLVLPHYGHVKKLNPNPVCFRDLDLQGASCRLAFDGLSRKSQWWILLAIYATENIMYNLPRILIPD